MLVFLEVRLEEKNDFRLGSLAADSSFWQQSAGERLIRIAHQTSLLAFFAIIEDAGWPGWQG